jgi:MFS family permease
MLFQMRRASQHAARCLSKYRIWFRLDARLIRRLISGDAGTCIGEQIALAAAPIIAVLLLCAGAGETGLLQTALTLPFLVFAIPAGLMTDRLPRAAVDDMGRNHPRCISAPASPLHSDEHAHLAWSLLALLGFIASSPSVRRWCSALRRRRSFPC